MPTEDGHSQIALAMELGTVKQSSQAAHTRIDKLELTMTAKLDELLTFMNRSKGWAAASIFFATIAGGLITAIIVKVVMYK